MNAFYKHRKDNVRFGYRCFDRILLNGLIQSFQQPSGWSASSAATGRSIRSAEMFERLSALRRTRAPAGLGRYLECRRAVQLFAVSFCCGSNNSKMFYSLFAQAVLEKLINVIAQRNLQRGRFCAASNVSPIRTTTYSIWSPVRLYGT